MQNIVQNVAKKIVIFVICCYNLDFSGMVKPWHRLIIGLDTQRKASQSP